MVANVWGMVFHEPARTEDQEFDRALRPTSLTAFVGQARVVENLRIAITAARARREPLDHVIFSGPPGLGKTTLAHLIAHEMGSNLTVTSGPALLAPKDLAGALSRQQRGDVLFIDEIHRMPKAVEEYLYTAMEDHAIDVSIDRGGETGRLVRLGLQPFTLVAATTREGLLSGPLRTRFGLVERLEPYPEGEIAQILDAAARRLEVALDAPASTLLASRSRGVPRMALRVLRRARDLAQVRGKPGIDVDSARECLERLRIDALGLEEMDRRILRALIERPEPTGLKTLAAVVDEAEDTLEEVFEPHLLRCGLIARTPRGRIATARAFTHLGLRPRAGAAELPFAE
jgi:Holliday junction DNA helicase RuvB